MNATNAKKPSYTKKKNVKIDNNAKKAKNAKIQKMQGMQR